MKFAKKTSALLLALALMLGLTAVPAFAAEASAVEKQCIVTVTETADADARTNVNMGTTIGNKSIPNSKAQVNLGTSGSRSYSWSIDAGSGLYSADTFKTESEKLVVTMKASPSTTSITVYLYTSNGSQVASQTVSVGTILNKTVTFSNLTSANYYYFRLVNNDQHTATISGTFAAK